MNNKILETILVPIYQLTEILQKNNFYLGFRDKKWILFQLENNKMKKIVESSNIENLIKEYNELVEREKNFN